MFLREFGPIEAEAFLTLAAEMIEEDGVVTAEEDAMLEEYKEGLNMPSFTYDAAAAAAARFTLSQLNEVSKRKVYMELYGFAMADGVEAPEERRALNTLRDALSLDPDICLMLEQAVDALNAAYEAAEAALSADGGVDDAETEAPEHTEAAPEA